MQIYWSKLIDVVTESPEVKTFIFECPEDYTWDEGSHIHLAFEGFNTGEKTRQKPDSPHVDFNADGREQNRHYHAYSQGII